MIARYFHDIDAISITEWLRATTCEQSNNVFLALLPEAEKQNTANIQKIFNDTELVLYGAIFPSLIVHGDKKTKGCTIIRIDDSHGAFIVDHLGNDPNNNAHAIGLRLRECNSHENTATKNTVFFIFDATLDNIGSTLESLFEKVGDQYKYYGVNSGSENFNKTECLFNNTSNFSDAVLAIVLPNKKEIALRHDYPVSSPLMRATSAQGNKISRINGHCALDVYRQMIYSEYGVTITHQNFYEHAVHYPFGLVSSLEVLIRIPVEYDDDGSVVCIGEVPPNSALTLIKAPDIRSVSSARDTNDDFMKSDSKQLIFFYCAGRHKHLGEHAALEMQHLFDNKGNKNAPLGALSLGEIGTDPEFGTPVFHNAAIVGIQL